MNKAFALSSRMKKHALPGVFRAFQAFPAA